MNQPTRVVSKAASIVWDFPAFETVGDRMPSYTWIVSERLYFMDDFGSLVYANAAYFDRMIKNVVY